MNLSTPVQQITGIGPVFQKKLKKLGIRTVGELIFHFPHRYEDFSNVIPVAKIKAGERCSVQGRILKIQNSRTWKKKIFLTEAIVQDETGAVKAVWFNQPYLANALKEGEAVMLSGKGGWRKGDFSFTNPAYEKIENCGLKIENSSLTDAGKLIAVYPETDGLSSRWLRHILKTLLAGVKNNLTDPLPTQLAQENNLTPLGEAIWQIHFPDSLRQAEKARERFAFQNAFFIQLWVMRERMKLAGEKAIAIPLNLEFIQRLVSSLPFRLTDSQKKSAWQILKDLEKPRPMNRLLEGDVGSGKTVVAALAILNTVKAGYQAALMAPTEILAKQHFKTIWELLNNFKMDIGLLTGKADKFYSKKLKNQDIEISRKKLLEKAGDGEINLIIGTHALISPSAPLHGATAGQSGIKFKNLALVIVDEQHRFGVEQRARLLAQRRVSNIPHLLSMTATPIPRTLAMTLYGDLDLSLIDELPQGRKQVITKIISAKEKKWAYDFIKKEIRNGRQAFVICPRIEAARPEAAKSDFPRKVRLQSSWVEVKAVKEEYEKLSKEIFPDLRVVMLHGKMTGREKEKVMRDFKNKKADILISTSVVEVGIDVPNATVTMIEGAERFGLAQLHQFRGRVGRSHYQSYCFLFTSPSASDANARLKALVSSASGFDLAEKDLEIRGPGDFLGKRQWGSPDLLMEALKNIHLVEKTRQAAKQVLENDPTLKNHPLLQEKLKDFGERMHWE